MKKCFLGLFAAFVVMGLSAFTISTKLDAKNKAQSIPRYWYESDDITYTGRYCTAEEEIAYLEANVPDQDFFFAHVSGSQVYEFGYSVQNPSGSPAESLWARQSTTRKE